MLRHYDQHGGGVRVYTQRLLQAMLELRTGHEFVFLYRNPALIGTYAAHRDAAAVESAGLLPYVAAPPDGGWPTLGEMVDSGQRLVVLMENRGGGTTYPWLLQGFDWVQDTPYLFHEPGRLLLRAQPRRPGRLALPGQPLDQEQDPDRSRTPQQVNARAVLLPRLRGVRGGARAGCPTSSPSTTTTAATCWRSSTS